MQTTNLSSFYSIVHEVATRGVDVIISDGLYLPVLADVNFIKGDQEHSYLCMYEGGMYLTTSSFSRTEVTCFEDIARVFTASKQQKPQLAWNKDWERAITQVA